MSSMLARGGSVLAASLLFLLGVYHFFAGIAGFARDNFYNVGQTYPYQASSDGWGWIHVIGGVALVLVSLALFSRRSTWARPVAIALCGYSAIANFFFLAYFPLWALLMIPLAIFCIWALVRDGQDQRETRGQDMRGMSSYGSQQGQPQQTGFGTQQHAGAYGTGQREPAGTGSYVSSSASGSEQGSQRWPQNVEARSESQGQQGQGQQGQQGQGRWSPSDIKESASRLGDKVQEHAQSGARGGGQRNVADEAAERARQAKRGDYRSGR